jgi:hypothetical protein
MKNYTVIWRDGGDDFMFTVVDTDKDPNMITNSNWIEWAAEIEYADWDEADRIEELNEVRNNGYELLDVLAGTPESVL